MGGVVAAIASIASAASAVSSIVRKPKAPSPPPAPVVSQVAPVPDEAAVQKDQRRDALRRQRGRTRTVLTGQQGVLSPVQGFQKTLLGQ